MVLELEAATCISSEIPPHGGDREQEARCLGLAPSDLLDASASLVPFAPPRSLRMHLRRAIEGAALRCYPNRRYGKLRQALASAHGIDPDMILPGNGAAELLTWAARDATAAGVSGLPQPGFGDYIRALNCWGGAWQALTLPLIRREAFPQPFSLQPTTDVLWITNPHNPTGQLWSFASLETLLTCHRLVICDEAFLPLVPGGEIQSLLPLVSSHPNLIVIRSLTKLYALAGLRLGYAVASPKRLHCWWAWRDPWPVNGLAAEAGAALLGNLAAHERWISRVQNWVHREGAWLKQNLDELGDPQPLPSAANFLLLRSEHSLLKLRESLARHHILLRDCRSFNGLGPNWLRLSYQTRRDNIRILRQLRMSLLSL